MNFGARSSADVCVDQSTSREPLTSDNESHRKGTSAENTDTDAVWEKFLEHAGDEKQPGTGEDGRHGKDEEERGEPDEDDGDTSENESDEGSTEDDEAYSETGSVSWEDLGYYEEVAATQLERFNVPAPSAITTARQQFFATAELLQEALQYCDAATVLHARRVSKNFRNLIRESIQLQRKLWLQPDPNLSPNDGEVFINPILFNYRLKTGAIKQLISRRRVRDEGWNFARRVFPEDPDRDREPTHIDGFGIPQNPLSLPTNSIKIRDIHVVFTKFAELKQAYEKAAGVWRRMILFQPNPFAEQRAVLHHELKSTRVDSRGWYRWQEEEEVIDNTWLRSPRVYELIEALIWRVEHMEGVEAWVDAL